MMLSSPENLNINSQLRQYPNFGAKKPVITKPVDTAEKERKKKRLKNTMLVSGGVLGLSLLVTVFNPKMSSKLVEKLRYMQFNAKRQLEKSKDDLVKTKIYKFAYDAINWSNRFLSWTNNINSVKDTYYKQLCTEEKTFYSVYSLERRKRLSKFDNVFRKVMKRPHELITLWGDKLAKRTVSVDYKIASKKMDSLEKLITEYSDRLPKENRGEIILKLSQVKSKRQFFSNENLTVRFAEQENLMKNLNNEIRKRWQNYKHGFTNKYVNNSQHFDQNLSFWAQDIMQPEREKLENKGKKAVESLFGNNKGEKGLYREITEKISDNLNNEEKKSFEKALNKAAKSLEKANENETCNYFDKKRDLVLGSAPTDILSSLIGISLGGVALVSANDRDKKISRLLTGILPTIAGLGTNIALTTMLFSGTKGMLYGILAGVILSFAGSRVDKIRLQAKNKPPES